MGALLRRFLRWLHKTATFSYHVPYRSNDKLDFSDPWSNHP